MSASSAKSLYEIRLEGWKALSEPETEKRARAMRRLFEYEPFHAVQTMFSYAYTLSVHDWKEKTPKRRYKWESVAGVSLRGISIWISICA